MFLALTLISQEAFALKVNNNQAAGLLSSCLLAEDAKEKVLPDGSFACCSKSEKKCIWCPANFEKACVVKPTKITAPNGISPLITTINPVFFNDLTKEASPKGGISPKNNTLSSLKNFLLRNKAESVETKKYDSGHVKQQEKTKVK